ncbi:MAG: ABC transporter permease [Acidobacteriota bacterium]
MRPFFRPLAGCILHRHGTVDVVPAIHEVGVLALPVVALVAIFVGTNVTLAGCAIFAQFGRQSDVGIFVALAGVREMAPVAAAFMLAAKSGAAVAALIATMRLGGQITALEAMSVDPFRHLALPRLLALAVAAPALVMAADLLCLVTGFVVAVVQLHVEPALYWENVRLYATPFDIAVGAFKGLVFGIIIAISSLLHGFAAPASPEGVGRASNHAVVTSTVSCIVVNYLLTQLFYSGS